MNPMTPASFPTGAEQSLKVLIVEDQIDLAENLFEFLGEDRYQLDFAADGLTALHLLATQHYDVIVLDLMVSPASISASVSGATSSAPHRSF